MRLFLIIWCWCLVICSCNENKKVLLQANMVNLAQPKIIASNAIIDSFVTVKANLKLDGVAIHYTTNGEEPKISSKRYTEPIKIEEACVYKFKAFHEDWKPSNTSVLALYNKGLAVDTIIMHTTASKQYSGLGNHTLINHNKGTLNFRDVQWVGYDTIGKSTLVLKDRTYVKSLTVGYLTDVASWIFPPSHVAVVIDGDETSKQIVTIEVPETFSEKKIDDIVIPINRKSKSLTIAVSNLQEIPKWHDGAGAKAWLFMDEWILNE